jgi:hypothetical protein
MSELGLVTSHISHASPEPKISAHATHATHTTITTAARGLHGLLHLVIRDDPATHHQLLRGAIHTKRRALERPAAVLFVANAHAR